MADWKETLEPYIKVQESVKRASLNPTAGEDLIIGITLVSDAGPCTPTLVSGQTELRDLFASQDITKEYIEGLDKLYPGAGQMWANAYRLAGSTSLLVSRASKGEDLYFAKSLPDGDGVSFILKGDELLRRVDGFDLVINSVGDSVDVNRDGWAIGISDSGVYGCLVDGNGPEYDYFCNTLPDLIDNLNKSSKFLATECIYYKGDDNGNPPTIFDEAHELNIETEPKELAKAVYLKTVYVANNLLDTEDARLALDGGNVGVIGLRLDTHGSSSVSQRDITEEFNELYSFESSACYAINKYNSRSDLRVRIRRFNHTAVVGKEIGTQKSLGQNGASPWTVSKSVLDTITKSGLDNISDTMKSYDFYEIAIQDPRLGDEVYFFNIGSMTARGDMTVTELNSLLSMIYLELPEDLAELGLNYYGYTKDDIKLAVDSEKTGNYTEISNQLKAATTTEDKERLQGELNALVSACDFSLNTMKEFNLGLHGEPGKFIFVASDKKIYKVSGESNKSQYFVNLGVTGDDNTLISVSDSDLQRAAQLISENEVYVVEGLCDLGNTNAIYQNYLANMAVGDNYFYPISPVNSTNYMTIANKVSRINQDSYKLYCSAPWDVDTGTLGWKFYASPSVLYWEMVSENRRNNEEFKSCFGQVPVGYQSPTTEFNRRTRQLLLTKKINTVMWDTQTQAWNMNDNKTKQTEDDIMADESNSRLAIRIAKATPILLRQFIGKKITEKLCKSVEDTLKNWIKETILPMRDTIEAYDVKCVYDEALARKNKVKVVVAVRFSRALKFFEVYNNYFDTGMELSTEE